MSTCADAPSIQECLAITAAELAAAGVDSAQNDAELLMCAALGLTRTQLHLDAAASISAESRTRLDGMVRARARRLPLQHIVGSVAFRRLEVASDRRALVPRPETELLAGQVIAHLLSIRDRSGIEGAEPLQVVDLCTGSGVVALSVAAEVDGVHVWASDISDDALDLARANASLTGLSGRVEFQLGDLFAAVPRRLMGRFDAVVANPPYVADAAIDHLAPEVRDHDPRIALDGGADGLGTVRRIIYEAGEWMRDGGLLALELGAGQWSSAASLAKRTGLRVLPPGRDLNDIERFLLALRIGEDSCSFDGRSRAGSTGGVVK